MFWQTRLGRTALWGHMQTSEAKDNGLPRATGRSAMDSITGIVAYIPQVCADGADKVFVSVIRFSDFTSHDRLDGGSQRGTMRMVCAGGIVIVIDANLFI